MRSHIKGQVCYTGAISHPFFLKFPDLILFFYRNKTTEPYLTHLSSGTDDCIVSSHEEAIDYAANKWLKLYTPEKNCIGDAGDKMVS